MTFDFRDLFIFEMANNHQGRVDHGKRIIREMAQIAKAKGVRAAIKFQFRDLETFIHPDHRGWAHSAACLNSSVELGNRPGICTSECGPDSPNKHIRRFQDTALSKEEFAWLVEEVRKNDLITMATPFDEPSVDMLVELGIEVVKIGSCSAQDWPLIEKVAEVGKPVVFSTGGLTMRQIDDVSAFFDSKGVHHAIMHCVAIYPTPAEHFQLNQIAALCRRYPNKVIGFSSHEGKWQTSPITLAYALGARIFERHVGIEEKSSVEYGGTPSGITLNAYSADPIDVRGWLDDYAMAKTLCGATERPESTPEEQAALQDLKRGVYSKIYVTGPLLREYVYFAMPCVPGQLTAGEWKAWGLHVTRPLAPDDAIMRSDIHVEPDPVQQILYTAVHTIKGMLAEAKIALPPDFKLEFSHHQGLVMFPQVGATIIEVVNRAYCKKLIIMMPGQSHPRHYHIQKEETFQILSGFLDLKLGDRIPMRYGPGDVVLIQRGIWHEFSSEAGCIVEEISTTHFIEDSFYADPLIKALKREDRKTIVEGWGRFQI